MVGDCDANAPQIRISRRNGMACQVIVGGVETLFLAAPTVEPGNQLAPIVGPAKWQGRQQWGRECYTAWAGIPTRHSAARLEAAFRRRPRYAVVAHFIAAR